MDTLEKTIDWTPMTESPPPESNSYLVTRKDPLLTTTAFYEHGEWWDGPLCEWAWPEGMIIAWKPMPEIDHIERTISTFFRDTYVHFKDKNIKPMRLWQDNLNESEDHIRYSTNHLVSPSLELIGETYISDESYTHKWLVAQGGTELLERVSITIDVDVIYAYDNVNKVEESSEDGEVHGVLINSTMYLRESEIKQVAQLIKDEKLRNRVLTLMRSHRRIVSDIREIASAQMLSQV